MIKIIALLSMLCDHIGIVFFPKLIVLKVIGRLAFPLFAWSIAEGFSRTKNFWKYAERLWILAIISQIPFMLLFGDELLNVCFTLLAGLLTIKLLDCKISFFLKTPAILAILAIAHFMNFSYGIYGIFTVVIFYICKNRVLLVFLQGVATCFGIFIYKYFAMQLVAILATPLIFVMKKYDFKVNKMLFYVFYPAHLLILYFIALYFRSH